MTIKRIAILALALLIFLSITIACNDWDGLDRTTDEYNGVLTRQVESREIPGVGTPMVNETTKEVQ